MSNSVVDELVQRDKKREAAERYVRECLVIFDGSVEAGMARIGTERYEETVQAVIKTMPPRKPMP